jgi:hypothetical protein
MIYPLGVKVRVKAAPDEDAVPWPEHLPIPTTVGVFEMAPERDGRFVPMLRLHATLVKMTSNITEQLGLGITYISLRRLMLAGFVRSVQITPRQYAFDLQSYYQHLNHVAQDPEFWTGKNLKRYKEAI